MLCDAAESTVADRPSKRQKTQSPTHSCQRWPAPGCPSQPLDQSRACQTESLRHALQLALCVGHMRAVHSASQKRATRHLEHVLSLREALQPTQHTAIT
jgi:hypothetical protein